jgi:hypothetical protein
MEETEISRTALKSSRPLKAPCMHPRSEISLTQISEAFRGAVDIMSSNVVDTA